MQSEKITIELSDGIKLSGYGGEYILETIKKNGDFYERKILDRWFDSTSVSVVYDIGANLGNHTVYFAKAASNAQIYAFEPFRINFELLSANVKDNNLTDRVHIHQKAIGSKSDFVNIRLLIDGNLGSASINADKSDNSESIEVVAIDGLKLPPPDFVKIDVEAYEVFVLEGMVETLRNTKNLKVWIEVDDKNAKAVYEIMTDLGFDLVDFSLEASNNILWSNNKADCLDNQRLFVKLLADNELKSALTNANLKYRNSTQMYSDLKSKYHECERQLSEAQIQTSDLIEQLAKSNQRLNETTILLAENLTRYSLERTEILAEFSQAATELGIAIDLLSRSNSEAQRLNAQVAILQKENNTYQWKLNRITDTLPGRVALWGYRFLKKIKRRLIKQR